MLGDINPQSIKITSQAVIYPGRDHVTVLNIKRFSGRQYSAVDLSLLTRAVLVFPQTDPVIAYDTATAPAGTITWAGSDITIDLSDFSMPASVQSSYLIVYDAEHLGGQVLVDDNDSIVEFDFRNVSATGIIQPPVLELVSEAPADNTTYGRKNGAWVSIDAVVAGVSSVNGFTGTVVLSATDVGAEPTGTAAAAVSAHEALGDPHPQYVTNPMTAAADLIVGGASGAPTRLPKGTALQLLRVNAAATALEYADPAEGGGAVDSVNGQTGVVVLDAADVGADATGTAAVEAEDARFQSTGVISGGVLSINGGDPTKFDTTAITVVFADYTTPSKSTATVVTFGPFTAVTVTNLATSPVSYIGINSSGTIIQQTTKFTNTQRRSIASIGAVVHSNHINLNAVNALVSPARQLLNQFGDGLRAIGQLNLSGNLYAPLGATTQIQRSAGELFSPGANFHVNPDDPHSALLSAVSPVTFRYRLANSTEYADRSTIDPANYDLAGVLTAVPSNRYTVQLIALFQSGITRIQYGQALYNTLSDAVSAAQAQGMVVESNILENGVIRGYLAVKGDASDLSSSTQAVFINLSKFSAAAAVSPITLATTDELTEGVNNLYFTVARVRQTLLTGLSLATNAAIAATDTVLDAFGKLQAQITAHFGVGGTAHPVATTLEAGFESAADKTKLDGIATGANLYVHPNHSGDVTSTGDGAQVIAANAVTNAKLADVATQTIKGRTTAATGDPEDLTAAQVRALINVADGANNYVHPNHSGDVTSVADGTQTIAANAVTNTKAADMAVNTLKGRITAGTGDPEDLTATQARTILNVANGATANSTDASLRDRTTHTGVQAISTVTGLQTALDSKTGLPAVATFTGNKTLALTDINTYNVSQDGTAQVVTVPAQATVVWTADAEIHIEQGAAGTVTVTGATGVTINGVSAGSFALAGQFAAATLKRKGSNSWTLIGSLANSIVTGPASSGDGNLALFNGTTGKVIKDGGVVTAAGLALLDDASAAAQATTLGLGTGNSPTFTALTLTNGQIVFPATQVPSANANTLDDYEEGTWTPVLTFATPGDLSVVYSAQVGSYSKIGRVVFVDFTIITSSFTHTTASGSLTFLGLPFAASANNIGNFDFQGITKAGYTHFVSRIANGGSALTIQASSSGLSRSTVANPDVPSGGSVVVIGSIQYNG